MNKPNLKKPRSKNLGTFRRKAVRLSQERLIEAKLLRSGKTLPLVVQPTVDGLDLLAWVTSNQEFIETNLFKYGAILFRNFKIKSIVEFEKLIGAISSELLEYTYRSTPRTQVSGKIYTSTEYPATQFIPLHNEMAYSRSWPMKIWFFCVKSAQQGGETPIADSRKVFESIPSKIREKFIEKQVMYVRCYGKSLDLPWQEVFQTTNKADVEDYCRNAGIEFEWKGSNNLITRQVCQAVATHPQTGDSVWFNQAHLFHISSLSPEVNKLLLAEFKDEELPRNAYYGDGSTIEISVLDKIREVYKQEAVLFSWQSGDILMLDNMLVAHGRKPFVGLRKVVVGMSETFINQNIYKEKN